MDTTNILSLKRSGSPTYKIKKVNTPIHGSVRSHNCYKRFKALSIPRSQVVLANQYSLRLTPSKLLSTSENAIGYLRKHCVSQPEAQVNFAEYTQQFSQFVSSIGTHINNAFNWILGLPAKLQASLVEIVTRFIQDVIQGVVLNTITDVKRFFLSLFDDITTTITKNIGKIIFIISFILAVKYVYEDPHNDNYKVYIATTVMSFAISFEVKSVIPSMLVSSTCAGLAYYIGVYLRSSLYPAETQLFGDPFSIVATLDYGLVIVTYLSRLTLLMFGIQTNEDDKRFQHWLRSSRFGRTVFESWNVIYSAVRNVVNHVLGSEVLKMDPTISDRISSYCSRVEIQCLNSKFNTYANEEAYNLLSVLIQEGDDLINETNNYKFVSPVLHTSVQKLRSHKVSVDVFLKHTGPRVEPVGIYLYGLPGTGKTRVVNYIANALSALHKTEGRVIFTKSMNSLFWDEYKNELVVLYDDFLCINEPTKIDEQIAELLLNISSQSSSLHMSKAEEKGRFFFTSPYVIATSNAVPNAIANNSRMSKDIKSNVVDMSAVWRRFPIQVEFTREGMVLRNFSMTEALHKFSDRIKHIRDKYMGKVINYDDLIEIIYLRQLMHAKVTDADNALMESVREKYSNNTTITLENLPRAEMDPNIDFIVPDDNVPPFIANQVELLNEMAMREASELEANAAGIPDDIEVVQPPVEVANVNVYEVLSNEQLYEEAAPLFVEAMPSIRTTNDPYIRISSRDTNRAIFNRARRLFPQMTAMQLVDIVNLFNMYVINMNQEELQTRRDNYERVEPIILGLYNNLSQILPDDIIAPLLRSGVNWNNDYIKTVMCAEVVHNLLKPTDLSQFNRVVIEGDHYHYWKDATTSFDHVITLNIPMDDRVQFRQVWCSKRCIECYQTVTGSVWGTNFSPKATLENYVTKIYNISNKIMSRMHSVVHGFRERPAILGIASSLLLGGCMLAGWYFSAMAVEAQAKGGTPWYHGNTMNKQKLKSKMTQAIKKATPQENGTSFERYFIKTFGHTTAKDKKNQERQKSGTYKASRKGAAKSSANQEDFPVAQASDSIVDQSRKVLERNVTKANFSSPSHSFSIYGVFIQSGVFMTVSHILDLLLNSDGEFYEGTNLFFDSNNLLINSFTFVGIPESDLCLFIFDHPNHLKVPNIIEKFWTIDDYEKMLSDSNFSMFTPKLQYIEMPLVKSQVTQMSYANRATGNVHYSSETLCFNVTSAIGWCGLPYFINLSHPKICAIHVAGEKPNLAYGSVITKDVLESIIDEFVVSAEAEMDLPVPNVNITSSLYLSKMWPYIEGKHVFDGNQRRECSNDNTLPLLSYNHSLAVKRLTKDKKDYDDEIYNLAKNYLTHCYSQHYANFVLTFEECLYGRSNSRIRSLPPDTSPGYPYSLSMTGKEDLFSNVPGNQWYKKGLKDLFEMCIEYLFSDSEDLWNGYVVAFPKDEDLRPGKDARVIYVFPIEFIMALKSLFGCVYAMIFNNCVSEPMSMGVNPFSDWTTFVKNLNLPGYSFIDLDQKEQDTCMTEKDVLLLAEWLYDMDHDEALYKARKKALLNVVRMPVWCGKEVIQRSGVNLSGQYTTSIVSSIGTVLLVFHLLSEVYKSKGKHFDLYEFNNNYILRCYGDDTILGVKQSRLCLFEGCDLKSICLEKNRIITPAEKTSDVFEFKSLFNCTYLKRSFVNNNGWVYCPLEFKSIVGMFKFWPRTNNEPDIAQQICFTALIEATQYGKPFYESLAFLLNMAYRKAFNMNLVVYPFFQVLGMVKNMKVASNEASTWFDAMVERFYEIDDPLPSAEYRNVKFKDVILLIHNYSFDDTIVHIAEAQMDAEEEVFPKIPEAISESTVNEDVTMPVSETIVSGMLDVVLSEGVEKHQFWPHSFSPKDFLPVNSPDIARVMKRKWVLATGNWTPSTPSFGVLQSMDLTSIFNHASVVGRINNYNLVRYDAIFSIVLNATRFHCGQLSLSCFPYATVDTQGLTERNFCVAPHVLISANNTTSSSIYCPYYFCHPWAPVGMAPRLYRIQLAVTVPLTCTGNGCTSVPYTIYVELVNTQLQLPFYSLPEAQMDAVNLTRPSANTASTTGDMSSSSINNTVSEGKSLVKRGVEVTKEAIDKTEKNVITGVENVVMKGTQKVGNLITNVVTGIPKTLFNRFGFSGIMKDKPNSLAAVQPTFDATGRGMQHCDGLSTAQTMTVKCDTGTPISLSSIGSFNDEMSITSIATRPGYAGSIQVAVGTPYMTSIGTFPVGPNCGHEFNQSMTPFGWIASFFEYWRGTVQFTFNFCATQFSSAKVRIVFNPSPSDPEDEIDLSNAFSRIVDIKGDTTAVVDIPFIHYKSWSTTGESSTNQNGSIGFLNVYLVQPVVSSDCETSAGVRAFVYINARPDIQFACPRYQNNISGDPGTVIVVPYVGPEAEVSARTFSEMTLAPIEPFQSVYDEGIIFGERIESIKQLAMRMHYHSTVSSNTYVKLSQWESSTFPNHLYQLLWPYTMTRGGFRVRLVRTTNNQDLFISRFWTENRPFEMLSKGGSYVMFPKNTNEIEFVVHPYLDSLHYTLADDTLRSFTGDNEFGFYLTWSTTPEQVHVFVGVADDFHAGMFSRLPYLYQIPAPLSPPPLTSPDSFVEL